MHAIHQGKVRFQAHVHPLLRDRFEALADGQSPHTLFVTCSDSRVDPSLITQTSPGEIFVLRNAGNLIPVHGQDDGSASAVEYAVTALKVQRIVVCGHSGCGAMGGLLAPEALQTLPTVARWIEHAEVTRRACSHFGADRLARSIEHNAIAQLDNLASHPAVSEALDEGRLVLEAWVYEIPTGRIDVLETRGATAA